MSDDTEFTKGAHPPVVLKFDSGVEEVDTAPLDTDSEDSPILETDHESRVTKDETIHRYTIVLRDGDSDSDDGGTDDAERNVSNDHRSWGDDE